MQVNFGVVMNELMGSEVKITVIATGFTRENLPAIERRNGQAADSAPAPVAAAPVRVETEPEYVAAAPVESPIEEPVQEEAPATMAATANGHDSHFDDLDVPAILRRRMIQ